jgi:GC-rich sequence DNA-binding factor
MLSFIDQELEDDATEVVLKKPDHSFSHRKKREGFRKRQIKAESPVSLSPVSASPQVKESPRRFVPLPPELGGDIPSAAAIHAAKKKRELARAIDDSSSSHIEIKPTNVVSDDDDNSDEEEAARKFGPTADASKQMQVLSALDNADSGSDEDKFVEEQMYKGVYSFPKAQMSAGEATVSNHNLPPMYNPVVPAQSYVPAQPYIPAQPYVPAVTFTPISVDSLQSQLSSQLSQLKEEQSSNEASLSRLKESMDTAQEEITSLERHSNSSSIQYHFFQEMRCYIRDLLLCLTEKVRLCGSTHSI